MCCCLLSVDVFVCWYVVCLFLLVVWGCWGFVGLGFENFRVLRFSAFCLTFRVRIYGMERFFCLAVSGLRLS